MPGFFLHVGAQVMCSHAGTAQPTSPQPRVTVSGRAIVTLAASYTVAGCTMPPPPSGNGPCVTARFLAGAARVTSVGQPVLLFDSPSVCVPTGTRLVVTSTQTRVRAT